MSQRIRYSQEVRDRAVRMVIEHEGDYASQWEAIRSIAEKIGCSPESPQEVAAPDGGRFRPSRRRDER